MPARLAHRIRVRGVVQGVGFRPYVFRLAQTHALTGWVLNGDEGVSIHVEGGQPALEAFLTDLTAHPPPAARIAAVEVSAGPVEALQSFEILDSESGGRPTTRVSPDLPICDACLREMLDPADARSGYPYINCTNCGPRFTIVRALPYDRALTTMASWPICERCARQYRDPTNRRFHAQPVACADCGPHYRLTDASMTSTAAIDGEAIAAAARLLREGCVVAVKGLGGYHLACDADNADAVMTLRNRKFRKERAFAVMVRDLAVARATVELTPDAERLLTSAARPIVLAPAREELPEVAPDNRDLGVMLPYTPVHYLLFASGAPPRLVMTSGNRSSEPIAYRDDDARARLGELADASLVGERPIARRVDDSIVRVGSCGPVVLRRSRGLAPGAVACLPLGEPVLALGGDLKNTITLVVQGQAYVSQHIGDLEHHDAQVAFRETVQDLVTMYQVPWNEVVVVHDRHPQYVSSGYASELPARRAVGVQHHRAHIASVLAEHGAFDRRVIGVALDGTGYGDDGTIWGGEIFEGSIVDGFERVGHLRAAVLPGGDAAARHPVQAAAGFLGSDPNGTTLVPLHQLTAPPFHFPERYVHALELVRRGVRTFPTTSAGRLFDVAAALIGFTRPITFEGQAAIWLEHLARGASTRDAYHAGSDGHEIDWRPTLAALIDARRSGVEPNDIARAFIRGLARAVASTVRSLLDAAGLDTVVLSGGVAQNGVLVDDIREAIASRAVTFLINHEVPPNDGGLSLGQAALALQAAETSS
ncbi:MAG TPA: carbamoyltransferase HypF [Vicinamibacterales bacterium]|jgi:hydrogenase maturation protein HypF